MSRWFHSGSGRGRSVGIPAVAEPQCLTRQVALTPDWWRGAVHVRCGALFLLEQVPGGGPGRHRRGPAGRPELSAVLAGVRRPTRPSPAPPVLERSLRCLHSSSKYRCAFSVFVGGDSSVSSYVLGPAQISTR